MKGSLIKQRFGLGSSIMYCTGPREVTQHPVTDISVACS